MRFKILLGKLSNTKRKNYQNYYLF